MQNQQPIFHDISYNKYIHNLFPKWVIFVLRSADTLPILNGSMIQ